MTRSPSSTEQEYDARYAGDYMDVDNYSTWAHADLRTRQVAEMLEHIPITPQKVLDYGCGVGGWLPLIFNVFKQSEIYGAEISHNAVQKAQERFPHFHFYQVKNNTVPAGDESFDMIFSYHVLEHVDNFKESVADIARLITSGGYACIIFPCGNPGSFLDRTMNLIRDSKELSRTGEKSYFFEIPDGHMRRLTSDETIQYFKEYDLEIRDQKFSGHFWGTLDWLCRGTGPAYINRVFKGHPAKNKLTQIRLNITHLCVLNLNRFIQFKNKNLSIKRAPTKHIVLFLLKKSASLLDKTIVVLASLEWILCKKRKSGTAQYLIFKKV